MEFLLKFFYGLCLFTAAFGWLSFSISVADRLDRANRSALAVGVLLMMIVGVPMALIAAIAA
jgi:uncharacterized membrane protein YqjE